MNRDLSGKQLVKEKFDFNIKVMNQMLEDPFHSFFADAIDSLSINKNNQIEINLEVKYDLIIPMYFREAEREAESCIRSSYGLKRYLHKSMLRAWSDYAVEFANYFLDYLLYHHKDISFSKDMMSSGEVTYKGYVEGKRQFKKDKGFTADMIIHLFKKKKHKDALSLKIAELYLEFYGSIRNPSTHIKSFNMNKIQWIATHRSNPKTYNVEQALEKYKKLLQKIHQKINIS